MTETMSRARSLLLALLALLAAAPAAHAAVPASSGLPTVSGTARAGQTLSSTTGSWTGSPTSYARQWLRCDVAGGACAEIAGATASSYVLSDDDVGSTIRVRVTATNADGSTSAESAATGQIAPRQPPVNEELPVITGTARDGASLTVSNGTWSGTATISYARRWLRCAADGTDCVALSQTGTSYTLTASDVGSTLRVQVTATNPDGTNMVTTDPTPVVAPLAPYATTNPAVTGSAKEGVLLSSSLGSWKGTPTIAYARQWERCVSGTCTAILGATADTYRLTAEDVGATVRVVVTATNDGGVGTATSAATATVTGGPPVNTALPAISGPLPRDGQTYTGTLGTWAGTAPLLLERQWLRCSSSGGACSVIAGETAETYTLRAADVGRTVRLEVRATNAHGSAVVQSAPSPVIGATPPVNEALPEASGLARDGETLTALTGTWSGTPSLVFSYAWQRCDELTGTCGDVPGATGATYRLGDADVGHRLRVRVAAVNGGGSAAATSAATDPVAPSPPALVAAPSISGFALEGATLTAATGTWSGTAPRTYAYQWRRCDSAGGACTDIESATAATYGAGPADVGHTIRVRVTASNSAGEASATTPPTAVIAASPPRNEVAPSVSVVEPRDGQTATASPGSWAGTRPLELSYRWQRCVNTDSTCADITGATDPTYTLETGDVGFTLRVVVRAVNAAGSIQQASLPTGVVLPNPPVLVSPPTVSGETEDGETLRGDEGEWDGLVPFTPTYRWLRCDANGDDCGQIDGAAGATYRLTPQDVGLTLRFRVLQANAGGTTAATSERTVVVRAAPPRSLAAPAIGGPAGLGRTLTADAGAWSGTPELTHTYQWRRCAADGTACADIDGATSQTYVLSESERDASVRVRVRTENSVGAAEAESGPTGQIQDTVPGVVDPPRLSIAGLVAQGATLEVGDGAWSGSRPLDVRRQWRRCDAGGNSCIDLAGQTGPSYVLTREDVGRRLVVAVTATNLVGSVTHVTDASPVVLPEPPANTATPVVTVAGGTPRDGVRATVSTGRWAGATPITYAVSWVRCDASGGACVPIEGADGTSYTFSPEDVGHRLRARVTATNVTAEATRDSVPTPAVGGAPPASTTRPAVATVDGRLRVGGRLRASAGAFSGTAPVRVALRWQRCSGSGTAVCDDIPGATGPELVLGEGDVGRRLRVVVAAENDAGSASADSVPTGAVPPVPPESVAPPHIEGSALDGAELRAGAGGWSGSQPLAMTYVWERCAAPDTATCPRIAGAARPTYRLTAADVGKHVRVSVTATNPAGRATRTSAATAEVRGVVPTAAERPAVRRSGNTMSATPGRWTGTNPITYAYRWQRCAADGSRCRDVARAARQTYTLTAGDVNGSRLRAPLRVVVTARNLAGETEAASAASGARLPATARRRAASPDAVPVVARVTLSRTGRLTLRLSCPRGRRRCAASGVVLAPRLRRPLRVPRLAAGRSARRVLRLTAANRRGLRGRRRVTVRVRLAPARPPRRVVQRRFTVAVPARLRGRARRPARPRRPARTTPAGGGAAAPAS